MIIACMIYVMINGNYETFLATGKYKKSVENYYIADFSNATSEIEGASGDYSNLLIIKENCTTAMRVRTK